MAFMHFGDFLQGMRLSAQDIADREKAELNRRFVEEQMAASELQRRMGEDELRYRGRQREMTEKTWGLESTAKARGLATPAALSLITSRNAVNADMLNESVARDTAVRAEYGQPSQFEGISFRESPSDESGNTFEVWKKTADGKDQLINAISREDAARLHYSLWNADDWETVQENKLEYLGSMIPPSKKHRWTPTPDTLQLQKNVSDARKELADLEANLAKEIVTPERYEAQKKDLENKLAVALAEQRAGQQWVDTNSPVPPQDQLIPQQRSVDGADVASLLEKSGIKFDATLLKKLTEMAAGKKYVVKGGVFIDPKGNRFRPVYKGGEVILEPVPHKNSSGAIKERNNAGTGKTSAGNAPDSARSGDTQKAADSYRPQ